MQPSNAEVRAGAVAKLKRATSLPRIKGGRRPPMPPDGSEKPTELPETNNSQDTSQNSSPNISNDADLPLQTLPPHPHPHQHSSPLTPPASTTATQLPPPDQEEVEGGHDPPDEPNNDDEPNGQSFSPPPTPTKRKRRSRSRTRTRSKDFKSKTPPPVEESSPEAKHSFLPTDDDIPLPSTIPSRPSPLPFGARSPLPFTPPTAPSTPVPFGMGAPTLQDIQQMVGAGLHRSQSARANAMIKLLGGMDSTAPTLPLSNSISRSNTVTGTISDTEQRAAARQRMMGRLKNRVGGNQTDDLTTSGGEDGPVTPKKKRRRSRKSSNPAPAPVNGSSVIDDRDDRDGSISTTDTTLVGASADTGTSSRHHTPTPQIPPDMLAFIPFFSYQPSQPQEQLHNTLLPVQAPSPPPESEEPQPMQQPTPPSHNLPQWTFQLDSPPLPRRKHDDVVIEEDDPSVGSDAPRSPSPLPHPTLRDESLNISDINGRLPHTSDAPSTISAFSGQDVPIIMSADLVPLPYNRQDFPKNPFTTPLKEHLSRDEEEEEEEEEEIVVWHDEKNVNGSRSNERMTVVAASPDNVDAATGESLLPPPESMSDTRLQTSPAPPFSSEDEYPLSASSRQLAPSPQDLRATSPSPVGGRDMYPSAPSPSSAVALSQTTNTRESASSIEPMGGIGNFSNATGNFKRESYTDVGTDYEDVHTDKETAKEKMGWASKLKKTFVERSGSITGRRSRANSTTKRESATSGVSKVEVYKYDPSTAPPSAWSSPTLPYSQLTESSRAQPPGQVTVPASSSIHSFMPVSPHRRGQSPIPPASPAEMSRYGANDKLAPFPGLFKLDEERRRQQQRTRRMSMSSPNLPGDVIAAEAVLHTDNEIEVEKRERKLSHQYSDTGLLQKFRNPDSESISPTSPSTPHTAPLNGTSHKSGTLGSSWLPMSRNDLRKWYKANKINNSTPSPKITTAVISSPITPTDKLELPASRPGSRQQKFTDIFHQNKRNNNGSPTDFEDMSNPSMTPKSNHVKMRLDSSDIADLSHDSYVGRQPSPSSAQNSVAMRMRSQQQVSISSSTDSYYKRENETDGEGIASAPKASTSFSRPALSIIPEPLPSDRSWTPSASQTDSSLSYKPSESPETPSHPPERSSVVMQRLDSLLSREPGIQPIWSFLDEPPRKLIMSSSVTQIVDSETSRERFLFLFNDILVLAKPLEPTVMAMDRSFIVKNVIDLNTVQVIPSRRLSSIGMRHPFVQQFVRDFNENPDLAVANLLQSTGLEDDPVALGKLLFNTIELDRTRLGAYLAKKAKKTVLRTYIDCFGLAGIRIDQALRAFALTLRFPPDLPEHSLEHVLNMFASRWFDANAKSVSHGKDLAMKLVRILVHLDNQLQKSIRVPHQAGYRDFSAEWESMVRAVDPRGILPDDSIQDMYYSLWNNPIRWAADPQYRNQNITFKRAPPNHLVYRIQSDPITIRIQQPDPHLRIQLLSQDGLVFDPPELNFARSTEAAFRVTGSSLGPKSIIFSLLGPHAPFYRGLPYSKTIVVERSFMRNTFQIAFKDPDGSKRRYMFSTEDAVVCNQYMMNVQPPQPTPIKSSHNDLDFEMAEAQRAAKSLSLSILREALSEKLSGHDLILICKQNSLVASVLPSVTSSPLKTP